MADHFVNYRVGPPVFEQSKQFHAGPYPTWDDADMHRRDIAGYVGITNCFITETTPARDHVAVR